MKRTKRKADLLAKSASPSAGPAPIAQDSPKIKVLSELFLKATKEFNASGNPGGFDRLCASFVKILERASADDLYVWFTVLARTGNCVPFDRLGGLLHTLMSFDWYSVNGRHAEVLSAYSDAVVQAVAGSKNIVSHVYAALTKQFRCKKSAVGEPEMTTTKETVMAVHSCIRRLLLVVPTSGAALVDALEQSHPSKFDHHMDRVVYLEASFLVSNYCRETARRVLDMVVRHLLVLDVDIEMDLALMAEELTFSFEEGEDESKRKTFKQQQREKADQMDLLLEKVFDYVDSQHLHAVQGVNIASLNDFPPEASEQAEFFRTLLHVFDSRILPSPKAQFVQFILFYACSKSAHIFAPIFLSHLFSVFKNFSLEQPIRAAAAAYIGSFVSRFGPLNDDDTTGALTGLTNWTREYLERLPVTSAQPDPKTHHLFYVVCNCIFYIVCFRPHCIPAGFGFQMAQVMGSSLNPLVFTQHSIRDELCTVAQAHNILDAQELRTKIRENRRLLVAINSDIQFCFPFDPYMLSKGDVRLAPFYHHWSDSEADMPVIHSGDSEPISDSDDEFAAQAMSLGTPLTGSFAELFQASGEHGISSNASSANSPSFIC